MDIGTQTHLPALRELLDYRRRALEADLHAAEQARGAGGPVEAPERRDREEMARVAAALRRLDEGVYGDCLQCGQPIPLQRLLVQPAAERCAACEATAAAALRRH
ncbi:MAG TPA: TraR/DksA C4-type zinc finger protein [Albitalea sp.]